MQSLQEVTRSAASDVISDSSRLSRTLASLTRPTRCIGGRDSSWMTLRDPLRFQTFERHASAQSTTRGQ